MNESNDIKQLESVYGLMNEKNEDNKVWKSGECPEALGDSPQAHDLKPEENTPEQTEPVVDSKNDDKDNEYYLKKISERLDKNQEKTEKSGQEHINNSTIMSEEPNNIFDKLYSTIMEGDDPFADLGGMDDGLGDEDLDGEEELDLGGDEISLTLPRDLAEKLHDALMSQLGGEDEAGDEEDLGDDFGDEADDEMLGDSVVSEPDPKPLSDGKGKLQGKDNKVGGKLNSPEGGSADGGTVKEDPDPKPLGGGDRHHKDAGNTGSGSNKVNNPKTKHLGD